MSRYFDRVTEQYLQLDSPVLTGVPITMACWVYNTAFSDNEVIMNLVDKSSTKKGFMFYMRFGTGVLRAVTESDADSEYAEASQAPSVDTWHHVCAVYAAVDDRRCYLDGGNKGTESTSITPSGIDRTAIGQVGDSTPGRYLESRVAEAAIWNRALTDAEVLMLSKAYSPSFVPQSLVAYWPLVRDADTDIVGGFNLTAFNAPTVANHPRIIYPARISLFPPVAAGGAIDAAGQADSVSSATAGFRRLRVAGAQADSVSTTTAGLWRARAGAAQAVSVSSTTAGVWRDLAAAGQANSVSQTFAGATGGALALSIAELFRHRRLRLSSIYARKSFKGVF